MKKLINDPSSVVPEMLEGLVALWPGLSLLEGEQVIVRTDFETVRANQVALISGGGSGHEPAHAGYVGAGMLTAAVAGDVFTSPSPDAVLAAIRTVTGQAGALLIVKNYTGDRLNFGLAAELARAEGFRVEIVVIADDVSLHATATLAGRRGIAGTVLVHKIAGAAAASGASLEEVATEARAAAAAVGTMGVGLFPCMVPAAAQPSFSLEDDQIELGIGIHGEPGVARELLQPADELVDRMLEEIITEQHLVAGERVALLINNLGATPPMELNIVARRTLQVLSERNLRVERAYIGTFLSALEMAGCSLSLMRLDDLRLRRLDEKTQAPAWREALTPQVLKPKVPAPSESRVAVSRAVKAPAGPAARLRATIKHAMLALVAAEEQLTKLDRVVGDGDLGISLKRGAEAVLAELPTYPVQGARATMLALAGTLRKALGGTSGALYGVFLVRAGQRLGPDGDPHPSIWAAAFCAGCQAIGEWGGARLGDSTMLDALLPAAEVFAQQIAAGQSGAEAGRACLRAAEQGAQATAAMVARHGRASYLGERTLGHSDPGARAAVIWIEAIAESGQG
jgi:dihydroxyacetone kinase